MKIVDKIKSVIGNEKIGEINGDRNTDKKEVKVKSKQKTKKTLTDKQKPTKKENTKIETKVVTKEESKSDFPFDKSLSIDDDNHAERYIKTDQVGGRSRRMILDALNIDTGAIIPHEFITPEQIENVEFTISVPSGLDSQEVESFCDLMEGAVEKYRKALLAAYEDKEKLIEEIVRTEKAVIERRNQDQLDSVLNHSSDEREQLHEKLIIAQTEKIEFIEENKRLKLALKERDNTNNKDKTLLDENLKLKEEIESLKSSAVNTELTTSSDEMNIIQEELNAAREQNAKLSEQIKLLSDNTNQNKDEELNQFKQKTHELEQENKKLIQKIQSIGSNDSPKELINESDEIAKLKNTIQDLEDKLKNTIPNQPPVIETPDDYEKKVMAEFRKKNKVNKHVKKKLTEEDIQRMKAAQSGGDIKIKGFDNIQTNEKIQQKPVDPFDAMMSELNED